MSKKLETMDAETLMITPIEPLKFIVSGLLPEGLHVLAGSPKIGKSWLALWICLQAAKGEKVWEFETLKSEVLYLCLEDSFARIQSRLFEITDEAPPTLHFAIMSATIGNGLEHQIESFITEHSDTGLIVIDTLQKVRKPVSANVNPYASDYDDINTLKQIADHHHLAILLVHHLRKTGDADPLNMISGTNGIAGGADTNFGGSVVQLGRALERLDNPVPLKGATTKPQQHTGRKKKLAVGQKEDDHSGHDFEMKM